MKLLWFSPAPWCQSGYGSQTELVTKAMIEQGHTVHIAASYGLAGTTVKLDDGRVVHPSFGEYSQKSVGYLIQEQKYDALVCLFDAWPMNVPCLLYTSPSPRDS